MNRLLPYLQHKQKIRTVAKLNRGWQTTVAQSLLLCFIFSPVCYSGIIRLVSELQEFLIYCTNADRLNYVSFGGGG